MIKGRPDSEIVQEVLDYFDIDNEFNFEERYLDDLLNLFRQTLFKLMLFLGSTTRI